MKLKAPSAKVLRYTLKGLSLLLLLKRRPSALLLTRWVVSNVLLAPEVQRNLLEHKDNNKKHR